MRRFGRASHWDAHHGDAADARWLESESADGIFARQLCGDEHGGVARRKAEHRQLVRAAERYAGISRGSSPRCAPVREQQTKPRSVLVTKQTSRPRWRWRFGPFPGMTNGALACALLNTFW